MKHLYIILLLILPIFGFSQGESFWKKTNDVKYQQNQLLERTSTPSEYNIFTVDIEDLKSTLQTAPSRESGFSSNTFVQFPWKVVSQKSIPKFNLM